MSVLKRFVSLILIFIFVVSLSGCFVVNVRVPEGKDLKISSKKVRYPDARKKIIYILWGLVPLTDNSTKDILADYPDGSEVSVRMRLDIWDLLINAVLGSTLTIYTVTVEAERIK